MNRSRIVLILLAVVVAVQFWWLAWLSQTQTDILVGSRLSWMSSAREESGLVERDVANPCGVVCLSVLGNLLDKPVLLDQSRDALSPPLDGIVSMAELEDACASLGFVGRSARASLDVVPPATACIAHVGGNHFVVIRRDSSRFWTIIDAPFGTSRASTSFLRKHWDGTGVYVAMSDSGLKFLQPES